MSESSDPVLPFDIIEKIIDILFIDDDEKGLQYVKEFSLTCQSFLPLCRKRIFSSTEIRVGNHILFRRQFRFKPVPDIEVFERQLLEISTIATYIRQLTIYFIPHKSGPEESFDQVAQQLTRLQSLTVSLWSHRQPLNDWNVPSSTHHSLVNLMHLPTLSRLSLQGMKNFPISDLITCTNIKHLSVGDMHLSGKHDEPGSSLLNKPMQLHFGTLRWQSLDLLEGKRPDGRPALDLTSLQKIYMNFYQAAWEEFAREIFKKTEQITDIHFDVGKIDFREIGLATMIAPSLQTLRRLELELTIDNIENPDEDLLLGLPDELKDISGRNRLESIKIHIGGDYGTGDEWGRLESVLLDSGWPLLKHVSLVVDADSPDGDYAMALQSLPQTQFAGLMSRKGLDFQFSIECLHTRINYVA